MTVFSEIAEHYARADATLERWERDAVARDDEAEIERAARARHRNDQAYFLYLFSRFEAEVDIAAESLLSSRAVASIPWTERRAWQAWARGPIADIALLAKIELLLDKGGPDYALARTYYRGRNLIAHGRDWAVQLFVPDVAIGLAGVVARFVRT